MIQFKIEYTVDNSESLQCEIDERSTKINSEFRIHKTCTQHMKVDKLKFTKMCKCMCMACNLHGRENKKKCGEWVVGD